MKRVSENPFGKTYVIPFSGLSVGIHEYTFEAGKKFFEHFENLEFDNGEFVVNLKLHKQSSMMILDFQIKGSIEIPCDRCGEVFKMKIDAANQLVVKIGGTSSDENSDVVSVSSSENEIDISHYMYEYIILGIPAKRVHPDDENGNSGCDPEVIKKLNEIIVKEDAPADSRWNKLKNIKLK